jgi:hypothetical protein
MTRTGEVAEDIVESMEVKLDERARAGEGREGRENRQGSLIIVDASSLFLLRSTKPASRLLRRPPSSVLSLRRGGGSALASLSSVQASLALSLRGRSSTLSRGSHRRQWLHHYPTAPLFTPTRLLSETDQLTVLREEFWRSAS